MIYLALLIITCIVWLLMGTAVPLEPKLRTVINMIVALVLFLAVLVVLGVFESGVRIDKPEGR